LGQDKRGLNVVYLQDFAPGKDTAASRRLLASSEDNFDMEAFAIAPDGKRMIVSGWELVSSIMIADRPPHIFR